MKRWWWIGTTLVLLVVLAGALLRHQGVFSPARSAASLKPAHAMPAASVKPADVHVMQYLQTLLETWQSHAQEPTQRKP